MELSERLLLLCECGGIAFPSYPERWSSGVFPTDFIRLGFGGVRVHGKLEREAESESVLVRYSFPPSCPGLLSEIVHRAPIHYSRKNGAEGLPPLSPLSTNVMTHGTQPETI